MVLPVATLRQIGAVLSMICLKRINLGRQLIQGGLYISPDMKLINKIVHKRRVPVEMGDPVGGISTTSASFFFTPRPVTATGSLEVGPQRTVKFP